MSQTIINSGYFGQSSDNIVHVKNFVDKVTISKLYEFSKNIKNFTQMQGNETWDNRVYGPESFQNDSNQLYTKVNDVYAKRLKKEIEKVFGFLLEDRNPSIVIWRPGDFQPPHADKEQPDGSPNPFPFYDLSSLIYINDDYKGGEIYFPQHDIEIKPSAGDAVFFPGDRFYLHGVKELKEGLRFTIPIFWTAKEKL
jgi:hypothetical protein